MSRLRVRLACVLVALGASVAHAQPAADAADCEYIEVWASNSKDPVIDQDLKPLQKKLKKPPFSAWNTFRKLSSGAAALGKSKPETLRLKKGTAGLMLRDRTEKRIELTVTMDNAEGKRVLDTKAAVTAREYLVVGGNVGDDGHILALTCR